MKNVYASCALGALLLCGMKAGLAAKPEIAVAPVKVTIEAKAMTQALAELAAQTGVQLMFSSEDVDKKLKAPALSGMYTPQAALDVLLANSGLGYRVIDSLTIAIRLVKGGGASSGEGAAGQMRMAKAENDEERDQEFPSSEETDSRTNQMTVRDTKVSREPFLDGNADLKRTIDDVQAYYIFDSKTIEQSGAANAEDFLKKRLTMNTVALMAGQTSTQGTEPNSAGNTSQFNLRGLGADKTLVLVNGRKMAGSTQNVNAAEDYQSDVNGIPLEMIDRIEVLPSSSSGIYGGGALGGVINIILKNDYTGTSLRTSYNNVWNADAPGREVYLSHGMSLRGGDTSLTLSASWKDSEPMLLQDRREVYERNFSTVLQRAPAYIFSNSGEIPYLGALPNIRASGASTVNLVLKDGRSLNSNITHVGAGISNASSQSALYDSLFANAGSWNLDLPRATTSATGLLREIGMPAQTSSAQLGLRHRISRRLNVFADFVYTENNADALFDPIHGYYSLSAASPYNPFTTAIRVRAPNMRNTRSERDSILKSGSIGAVAQLPGGWSLEFDYTHSTGVNDSRYMLQNTRTVTAPSTAGTFNPLVDALSSPIDFQKFLVATSGRRIQVRDEFAVRGRGSVRLFSLPSASLAASFQHQVRKSPGAENDEYSYYPVEQVSRYRYYPRSNVVDSIYSEITLPLVEPGARKMLFLHAFDVQVAGRLEKYSVDTGTAALLLLSSGGVTTTAYSGQTLNGQPYFSEVTYREKNGTVGFKYQPNADVAIRASVSTAFLPPTSSQLFRNLAPSSTTTLVTDPVTGQTGVPVYTLSGGNPDLIPQNSRNLSAGLIWTPGYPGLAGLRANVEYYRVEQYDYIASLSAQQVVDLESVFPGRVTRDAGRITQVDISTMNLYLRDSEGVDVNVNYPVETARGVFDLSIAGSAILHLKNQYLLTNPAFDGVGFPSEGGAARYKANAGLSWSKGGWSASWTARYFSSYRQFGSAGGPNATQRAASGLAPSTTYTLPQGGASIPSQMYHDLFLGYTFERLKHSSAASRLRSMPSGLSVQASVNNVFGSLPPFDAYYTNNFYLSPYGDIQLRTYGISLKKVFN